MNKMFKSLLIIAVLALLSTALPLHAASYVWTSTDATNNFYDNANWSGTWTASDTLTVDTIGTSAPVVSTTGLTVKALNIGRAFTGTPAASAPGLVTVNTGGVLNVGTSEFSIGYKMAGTLEVNGGTVTKATGSNFTVGYDVGSDGLMTMSSGSITSNKKLILADIAGKGTVTISGGNLSVTSEGLYIGRGGEGIWNQNGGSTTTNASLTYFGKGTASISTLNLNGGVFATAGFAHNDANYATVNINLNGGILRPNTNSDNFIDQKSSIYSVNVLSNGAKIDTNGYAITVPTPLLESATSTGGGLTKSGLGTLTLSGSNTYTGVTDVQAGTLLFANSAAFATAGTRTINVATGATLGSIYSVDATSANVAFSNKSHLQCTFAGYVNSTLAVGTISSSSNADRVMVDLSGDKVDGTYNVLTYASRGANSPTFLPFVDGTGRTEVLITDIANAIKATVTTNSTRGWIAATDGAAWHNAANWGDGIPNGTAAKAWFDESISGFNSHYSSVLDADATVSSLMFNGWAGQFSVQGSSTLTLQTSIADKAQIQVIGGAHTIGTNLAMVGSPLMTIGASSSLTLNGVVSGSDSAAGLTVTGGGTLILSNAANSYTGVTEVTGASTLETPYWPSKCLLNNGTWKYTNAAACTATSVLSTAGTMTAVVQNTGDIVLAGDKLSISPNSYFSKTGSGSLNLTYNDSASYALGNGFTVNKGIIDVNNSKITSTGVNTTTGFTVLGLGYNVDVTLHGDAVFTAYGIQLGKYDTTVSPVGGTCHLALSNNASLVTATETVMLARGNIPFLNRADAPKAYVTIGDSASIRSGKDIRFADGDFSVGDLTMTGGTIASATELSFAYGYGASSKLNISGGTISAGTILYFGAKRGGKIAAGDGIISGGTLTAVNNIYLGFGGTRVSKDTGRTDINLDLSGSAALSTPGGIAIAIGADVADPGTTANVIMSGHSSMSAGTSFSIGEGTTDSIGTLSMLADSSISAGTSLAIGNVNGGSGLITMAGNSSISAGTSLAIGNVNGGSGLITMAGNSSVSAKTWLAIGNAAGSTGTLTMSGNSSVTLLGTTEEAGELQVGWGGTGTVNLGGTATDTVRVNAATVQVGGSADAIGTINLKAGSTLSTGRIYSEGAPASSIVNFNGGVLKATADDGVIPETLALIPFINNDGASTAFELNVLAGGAIIDTNTFNVTIDEVLIGSTGDGGLKKNGDGMLTLALDPTYNGDTVVNAGTLKVTNLNTPSAEVYVATGGTLSAASIVADTLTIGGPASAASASVAAVPEPGTFVLLALAGMGAILAVWRRK